MQILMQDDQEVRESVRNNQFMVFFDPLKNFFDRT